MNHNQDHNQNLGRVHNQTPLSDWSNIVMVNGGYQLQSTDTIPHPPLEFVMAQNGLPLYFFHDNRPFYSHACSNDQTNERIRHLEEKFTKLEQELTSLRAEVLKPKMKLEVDLDQPEGGMGINTTSSQFACASSSDEKRDSDSSMSFTSTPTPVQERKRRRYVRKPKPDPNAPVKPLTGYATFANDIRKEYTDKGLCFAEIANRIGKDWQHMGEELHELYMSNAAIEKARYDAEMAKYRKTEQFASYQRYLESFRRKELEREEARAKKREQETRH